jgi:hypothetical protein
VSARVIPTHFQALCGTLSLLATYSAPGQRMFQQHFRAAMSQDVTLEYPGVSKFSDQRLSA